MKLMIVGFNINYIVFYPHIIIVENICCMVDEH